MSQAERAKSIPEDVCVMSAQTTLRPGMAYGTQKTQDNKTSACQVHPRAVNPGRAAVDTGLRMSIPQTGL